MCGPHRQFAPLLSRPLRRIPQAVSAVATYMATNTNTKLHWSFNTASGKCCCNRKLTHPLRCLFTKVSIPQAVSTVATGLDSIATGTIAEFQYRKR